MLSNTIAPSVNRFHKQPQFGAELSYNFRNQETERSIFSCKAEDEKASGADFGLTADVMAAFAENHRTFAPQFAAVGYEKDRVEITVQGNKVSAEILEKETPNRRWNLMGRRVEQTLQTGEGAPPIADQIRSYLTTLLTQSQSRLQKYE